MTALTLLATPACRNQPRRAPVPAVIAAEPAPPDGEAAAGPVAPVYLVKTPYKDTPAALLHPERLTLRAPEKFNVRFSTTEGDFVVQVTRAWAPRGAARFYNLIQAQFYSGVRVHRVLPGTLIQFGLHGDPAVNRAFFAATISDDPPRQHNQRGMVALAGVGKDGRRTEILINLGTNRSLDQQGVVPLGRVVSGMKVVEALRRPNVPGQPVPLKRNILVLGSTYLATAYPHSETIQRATVVR